MAKKVIGWSVKVMFTQKFFAAVFAAYVFLLSPVAYAEENSSDNDGMPAYIANAPEDDGVPAYIANAPADDDPPVYVTNPPRENPNPTPPYPMPPSIPVENPTPTPPPTPTQPTPKIDDGQGLEFLVYNKDGVMAFAIIAAHENYKLQPVLAWERVQGRATLSQMTSYYDDIAMINASYFEPNGNIVGVLKMGNKFVGTGEPRSAIGIKSDSSVVFGKVGYYGVVNINGNEFQINGVNCDRPRNSIVVYNNLFGASTTTNQYGVEVVVQNNIVVEIARGKGNNLIPYDGYVISVQGKADELMTNIHVGDYVNLNETILDESGNFFDAVDIVGVGPRLVYNGQVYVTADEEHFPADIRVGRAPRSAVGVTKYGDYIFAVVDGRQAHSRGCTLQEWASILINEFGAVNAINLDGGGSSELIVKDKVVNAPSDGKERPVGNALMIVHR